jgi:RecB family exonuclease
MGIRCRYSKRRDGIPLRRLITGDFQALEPAFLGLVAEIREDDPLSPVSILVNTHLLGLYLSRRLVENGLSHFNLRFQTLYDLADRIAGLRLAERGLSRMPWGAAQEIVRIASERLAGDHDGFYFGRISGRRGFHRAMLSTIADLKNAGLRPQDLRGAFRSTAPDGSTEEAKKRDFLRIWDHYESTLNDLGWVDESDVFRWGAEAAPGSPLLHSGKPLLGYGFYDFNQVEKNLVSGCLRNRDAVFFLPYQDRKAFDFARPALAWFQSLGFEAEAASPVESGRPPALEHLCRRLFEEGTSVRLDDSVELVSAPGKRHEIREAFRVTTRRCAERNTPLHDCAVLVRAPRAYGAALRETASILRLEPYMPEGTPLDATPAGMSLVLMLNVLREDFSRRSVMEFAGFADLPGPDPDAPDDRAAAWDVISMEAGIVEGIAEWEERLSVLPVSAAEDQEAAEPGWKRSMPGGRAAVHSLREFIAGLVAALLPIRDSKTWAGRAEAASEALVSLIKPTEHSEAVRRVLLGLGGLDPLGSPPTLSRFCTLVKEALADESVDTGKFQRSGPAVISVMAARGLSFRTVVIPGMIEKEFPPLLRQDAILLDHERRAVNLRLSGNESRPIKIRTAGRIEEERMLFALSVGSAGECAVLTWPRLEMGTGKERLPSPFLLAAAGALEGRRLDFEGLETFAGTRRIPLARIGVEPARDALDPAELELSLARRDIERRKSDFTGRLAETSPIFSKALTLEAERWGRQRFTRYDGVITDAGLRGELRDRCSPAGGETSPTRLETAATCPYKYLLENVMHLRALVEPEKAYRLSPLDRGEIVHTILFRFITELGTTPGRGVRIGQKHLGLLLRIAEEEFRRFEKQGVTGFPAIWALEQETIREWLRDLLAEEAAEEDYRPAYAEVRFGSARGTTGESPISSARAVRLDVGGGISVRGRIDRIDLTADRSSARIVDYKTGSPRGAGGDLDGGRNLQLPLYLLAARQLLDPLLPGTEVVSSEYLHLKTGGRKRHLRLEAKELEALRPELDLVLLSLSETVDAGRFFAVPGEHCRWCDYLSICGSSRHAIFERKTGDPAAALYLKVTGRSPEDGEGET